MGLVLIILSLSTFDRYDFVHMIKTVQDWSSFWPTGPFLESWLALNRDYRYDFGTHYNL